MFLTSLDDITTNTEAGHAFGIATWDIPTVSDNSGNYTLSSTHLPGDAFTIGNTTVTYTIMDQAGNIAEVQFVVQVRGRKAASCCTFSVDRQDSNERSTTTKS